MATERLTSLLNHLKPGTSSGLATALTKNPDDIVITFALRTPLAKGIKGGFKDTPLDYLMLELLKAVIAQSKIDPALVNDIACGNCNEASMTNKVRAAALAAGFPNSTAAHTIHRFCSSGLMSIQDIATAITNGSIEIGIAMGAESMTQNAQLQENMTLAPEVMANPESATCLYPMLQTSEIVGDEFNISREAQDRYSVETFARAEKAQKAGWFDDEILPINTKVKDAKGEVKTTTIFKDEGPRYGTTYESLSKIRPAAPEYGGKSTGGNSSQVTDGVACVLLMKRSTAQKLGQPIIAKYVYSTVIGLAPRIMGIGPSLAIPKLLSHTGVSKDEVDVYEINEAFASMAVYCLNTLGLDHAKMNPRGGAIALGHPLGCTGTRQVVTGLSELRRQNKKVLVTSMCVGSGQGMAGMFINEA